MSTMSMDTPKQRAERLLKHICEKNYGTGNCLHELEKEIKAAMEDERQEIIKEITQINYGFNKVPILMYFHTILAVVFKPRVFFYQYFKSVQKLLATKIQNR